MSKENTENKEQLKDKKPKIKKSSYSKKKKIKKNITNGIAYVQSTFNNTIVSIADTDGNIVSWASAGQKGFKGSRKSTPYAAQVAADSAAAKALEDFKNPYQTSEKAVTNGGKTSADTDVGYTRVEAKTGKVTVGTCFATACSSSDNVTSNDITIE